MFQIENLNEIFPLIIENLEGAAITDAEGRYVYANEG